MTEESGKSFCMLVRFSLHLRMHQNFFPVTSLQSSERFKALLVGSGRFYNELTEEYAQSDFDNLSL